MIINGMSKSEYYERVIAYSEGLNNLIDQMVNIDQKIKPEDLNRIEK